MKEYLAELVGTFVLVFGGVGSAVLAGDKIGFVGVSFAFGLALLAMVYTIGPISGCHINPAVTIGLLLHRKIAAGKATGYIVAQIAGSIIAAFLILLIAQRHGCGLRSKRRGTRRQWLRRTFARWLFSAFRVRH